MSVAGKRKNVAIIAGAILLLVALGLPTYWVWRSQNAYHQQAQNQANSAASHAPKRIERECGELRGGSYYQCAYQIVDTARQTQRNEYDLEAQRKAANGGLWLIVIGAIELLLTGVGLWIIYRQLHHSRVSHQTENRAWIEILPGFRLDDLRYVDGHWRMKVAFAYKNIGKSVALKVRAEASLIRDPTFRNDKSNPIAPITERLVRPGNTILCQAIFPQREGKHGPEIMISADDAELMAPGPTGLYNLAVVFAVRYNTIFDKPADPGHLTLEIGNLRRLDENGAPALTIVGKEDVPSGELSLIRSVTDQYIIT